MYPIAPGCVISKNPGPRLPLIGHSACFRLATCRYIAQFEATSGASGTTSIISLHRSSAVCAWSCLTWGSTSNSSSVHQSEICRPPARLSDVASINKKHSVWSRIVFCGHCCAADDLSGGRRPCCLSLSRSDSDTHTHTRASVYSAPW